MSLVHTLDVCVVFGCTRRACMCVAVAGLCLQASATVVCHIVWSLSLFAGDLMCVSVMLAGFVMSPVRSRT